jgi:hypothetical protein
MVWKELVNMQIHTVKTIRWESKSGKWWLEAYLHSDGCWTYRAVGQGGCLGIKTEEEVRVYLGSFVLPYIQPDTNKKPMVEMGELGGIGDTREWG